MKRLVPCESFVGWSITAPVSSLIQVISQAFKVKLPKEIAFGGASTQICILDSPRVFSVLCQQKEAATSFGLFNDGLRRRRLKLIPSRAPNMRRKERRWKKKVPKPLSTESISNIGFCSR
jgi:hypothetical protein